MKKNLAIIPILFAVLFVAAPAHAATPNQSCWIFSEKFEEVQGLSCLVLHGNPAIMTEAKAQEQAYAYFSAKGTLNTDASTTIKPLFGSLISNVTATTTLSSKEIKAARKTQQKQIREAVKELQKFVHTLNKRDLTTDEINELKAILIAQ